MSQTKIDKLFLKHAAVLCISLGASHAIFAAPNDDLKAAAEAIDPVAIEAALKSGAKANDIIDAPDMRALHIVLRRIYEKVEPTARLKSVRLLLAAGADPNAPAFSDKLTPLLRFVCEKGEFASEESEIISDLIKVGANVDTNDVSGRSPLTCAIAQRESAVAVAKLLELGAEPNPVMDGGSNYVHLAAAGYKRKGTEDSGKIIDTLIKFGVDFDTPNDQGETPLHIAARDGNEIALRAILKHKPNISRKNNEGKTAEDLAMIQKAKSGNNNFEKKLAALIRGAKNNPKLTEIGTVFSASERQVDITGPGIGKAKSGQKLLVRTALGDYTLIAENNMHSKLVAKSSPAAAARLKKGDKVFLK